MADAVIQLKCGCTNYPWGKIGHDSTAAVFASKTPGTDFKIEDGKPYAEMWFGTYPTLASHVLSSGENLQDVLNANKEKLIGKTVLDKFGADLPFLPKVLSIAKALPLQIHPDKDLAARLHKKDPSKFGDTNHKPEIAVALSEFEAFVGFKPLQAIQGLLQLPPLQRFLPDASNVHFNAESLKRVCAAMLQADDSTVEEVQSALSKLPRGGFRDQAYILDLLPRLQEQYTSADNGTLVALICMNYVTLKPGEAVWVPADGIHAWFAGDIIECMARSDNVLNTGFCPRADRDDIGVFTEALTFQPVGVDDALLGVVDSEKSVDGKTIAYKPPMSEFNVIRTELGGGEVETIRKVMGPSTMIVTGGGGKMVEGGKEYDLYEGGTWFIGQGVEVGYEAGKEGLVVYRAYAE